MIEPTNQLVWINNHWARLGHYETETKLLCGCVFHVEDRNNTHMGRPHIHPCFDHCGHEDHDGMLQPVTTCMTCGAKYTRSDHEWHSREKHDAS